MRRVLILAAMAAFPTAGQALAQGLSNTTVSLSVVGACTTSPASAKQLTECNDSINIYFTGSGRAYMFYPNTRDEGIQFDIGRKSRTTTIQKYDSVPRKVPVSTSSAMNGNTFTLSYQFDNRGRWPNGAGLQHRQMFGATVQFDGSGGCSVTAYAFAKYLTSNDRLLDDRVQRGFSTQTCRVVAGRVS